MYGYVLIVYRNQPEAVIYLQQAYERGILLAAYSLGEIYEGD